MKKSTVHIATTLQLIAIVALFSTAFMVNTSFFNHLISAKQYGVEVVLLLTVALLAFTTPFNKKVELTKADLLVILFAIWNIVSELILNTAYGSINETLFNTLLWGTVYLLMRQQLNKQLLYWGITTVFILVALTQATLGLAQLYRLTTSYRTLFSITGIFHNPGPFAGFVVSALPITLIMQVPPTLSRDNNINTIKSSLMNPSLLLPKYLLAILYNESNQTLKAKQTARDVLNSPIKVKSSATKEIIREMRKITNNNK